MRVTSVVFVLAFALACSPDDSSPDVSASSPEPRAAVGSKPAKCTSGTFPEWNHGANCALEPAIQVHKYNDNTFILRQSLCTSFEGPFMYLLFGDGKVVLEDT